MKNWLRDLLGMGENEEKLDRILARQEQISQKVDKIALQVADLRQQLDLDPMVDLRREIQDYTRGGDPMLGS